MSAQCVRCGAPAGDAFVCRRESRELAQALLVAAGHAEDAEAVITGQVRYGSGGGNSGEDPLPGNLGAAARLAVIGKTIGGWTGHVLDAAGMELPRWRRLAGPPCRDGVRCPHDSCHAVRRQFPFGGTGTAALWLAGEVDRLRRLPAAGEAFRDLHRACDDLARLVDRPAERDLVGMCDCGTTLYAPHGRTVVQCPLKTCKLIWDVERSRDILRRALGDRLVTAAEGAKLASFWDERSSRQILALIGAWVRHGLVVSHGEVLVKHKHRECEDDCTKIVDRIHTYRFGDIADRLAQTPRRNRQGAPA